MGNNLPKVNLGTGKTAKFISAGVAHTCAILNDDTLKCWGANTSGQLGYGNSFALSAPSAAVVSFENGRTVRAVSAGIAHTCVILDDNTVHCWGNNASGQLGLENDTNVNAPSSTAVNLGKDQSEVALTAAHISSRGDHSCVILTDGSAKCWGNNVNGQLGQNTDNSYLPTIGKFADQMGNNLPAISLGDGRTALAVTTSNLAQSGTSYFGNTCVILDDYTVKCWGANAMYQLGRGIGGTSSTGVTPGQMTALLPISLGSGLNAMQISLGAQHVCSVLGSYTVKCWGWAGRGQLGQGRFTNWGSCCMGDALPATNLNEPSAVTATAVSSLLTTTATPSKTATSTRTVSKTATPSRTRTHTKTRTSSPTKTKTKTPSYTRTVSRTRTRSHTRTATPTRTPTRTRTHTRTRTGTRTLSPTITVTP
jgi:alpha-tubulin suppressor-like RCC1 family protein